MIFISNFNIHLKIGNCNICNKSPVIQRKYSGESLCPECFIKSIERKIYKTISKYKLFQPQDKIVVGLSGGKDSISLLYNLCKIQEKTHNSQPLIALIIDEGINDYRENSVEFAKKFCKKYNIDYKIISFKEKIGKTLDEIIEFKKKSNDYQYACNYCAAVRRRLLNDGAKELGGTILAVGHNLTDVAETFLMNVIFKRYHLIANQFFFKERSEEINQFYIKKATPLMRIPEEEIFLYANLKKLKYYRSHCPYREIDPIVRKKILDFIQTLKKDSPEIEFNLFNGFLKLSEVLYDNFSKKPYNFCETCGYPCGNAKKCMFCTYKQDFSQ